MKNNNEVSSLWLETFKPRHEKIGFCICVNKDADQLISAFVFATQIEHSLFFLNPKFQASSHLLWLYNPVCVGPGQNPENRFSQNEAQPFKKSKQVRPEKVTERQIKYGSTLKQNKNFIAVEEILWPV